MELWIPITIAAAFFQNLRSALQKHLKGRLSTGGATYSRFCFAVPFALLYLTVLVEGFGFELPTPNARFILFGMLGGLAQIAATFLLVHLFSLRNFAVGNAYSKTETVQTALFGIVLLGDPISLGVAVAIVIALCGVVALSAGQGHFRLRTLFSGSVEMPALLGIFSGTLFGVSAVSYRAASLSLGGEGFLVQASFTLACVTVFQTLFMGGFLRVREPGEIGRVFGAWRVAGWVGLSGMLASAGWFTAMTLENAAFVRAVGQIELVFTFVAGALFFGERTSRIELVGIALILVGIVALVLQ